MRIYGTISNFMAGGRAIDPSWRLALEGTHPETNGAPIFDSGGNAGFDGSTQDVDENGNSIAGAAVAGTWDGLFYGEVTRDDPGTDANESVYPSGVAGTFDGHFNDGDVIGAYGAERRQ